MCFVLSNGELQMILAYGELFYLHRTLIKSETKAVMYWALQYVGRSEDKIQYNYVVSDTQAI